MEKLLSTVNVTSSHYRVAFANAKLPREKVLERIYDPIFQESLEKSAAADGEILKGRGKEGRGKLRYLGGWVVAKLRHKK